MKRVESDNLASAFDLSRGARYHHVLMEKGRVVKVCRGGTPWFAVERLSHKMAAETGQTNEPDVLVPAQVYILVVNDGIEVIKRHGIDDGLLH